MVRTRNSLPNSRGSVETSKPGKTQRRNFPKLKALVPALRDRSVSRGPSEAGSKQVRFSTPTPSPGPALHAIVGEISPLRAGDDDPASAPSSQLSGTSGDAVYQRLPSLALIIGEDDGSESEDGDGPESEDDDSAGDESESPAHGMMIVGEGDSSEDSASSDGGVLDDDSPGEGVEHLSALNALIVGEGWEEGSTSSSMSELEDSLEEEESVEVSVPPSEERTDSVGEDDSDDSRHSSSSSGADTDDNDRSLQRLDHGIQATTSPSMLDGILPNIPAELAMDVVRSDSSPPSTESGDYNPGGIDDVWQEFQGH
uniref:Zn(2)-C6 fungal-type domain-containing protein n=1 Tax=Ganoderma boninense TaxID=34458 RepID=A0A5K1JXD7_9APHY|nr:Zn(2)-C6 fungal-type domain-containing protein [Ganoderma boninense]